MPHNPQIDVDAGRLGQFQEWLGVDVPHLDQYFGLWAILEEPFRSAVNRVNGLDLRAHVTLQTASAAQNEPPRAQEPSYQVASGGIAVISLSGPMMKYASSLSGGTSTVRVRRQVRAAAADEDVRAILLRIDSPGGIVAGTRDLAEDVAAAAKQKSVTAYIEDMGASAAYWTASQATRLYANATALVGGIGTYGVIRDASAAAEKLGLAVHVLRAGKFKGVGTPGTAVEEEHLAYLQAIIEQLNEHFLAGVAAGRRMSAPDVKTLADGRVHVGQAAADLRLIDGVKSLDEVFSSFTTNNAKPRVRTRAMAETTTTAAAAGKPAPASLEDMKILCPAADNDFLIGQLDRKATADQAQSAWMEAQQKQIEASEARAKAAEEQAEAAAKKKPGVPPLGTAKTADGQAAADGGYEGDAVADYNAAVRSRVYAGMDRRKAVTAASREDPDRHRAYLHATNTGRKTHELIDERSELM